MASGRLSVSIHCGPGISHAVYIQIGFTKNGDIEMTLTNEQLELIARVPASCPGDYRPDMAREILELRQKNTTMKSILDKHADLIYSSEMTPDIEPDVDEDE
jgi:hypothetical protein